MNSRTSKGTQGKKKKDVPNQGKGHEKQIQERQNSRNHPGQSYATIRKVRESKSSRPHRKGFEEPGKIRKSKHDKKD